MANVPRLSKILRGKDTKPQTELESAIKYAIDNAGGGGSSLPTPGTAGNVLTSTGDGWESAAPSAPLPAPGTAGNVLTSTGEGWESAAPQGGDNDFVVEFTFAEDEVTGDITISTETAISAILAALDAGKNVKGFSDDDNGYNEYYLKSAIDENLWFDQPGYNAVSITGYTDNGDDVWNWSLQMPMIPLAGESDEGKILGVDNKGDYALVSPNNNDYRIDLTVDDTGGTMTITAVTHDGVAVTAAEVAAAIAAGKNAYVAVPGGFRLHVSNDGTDGSLAVGFGCVYPDAGSSQSKLLSVVGFTATNTWYIYA